MYMLIPFSQINIYANEGLQLNSSVPQLKIQPFKINTVTMYYFRRNKKLLVEWIVASWELDTKRNVIHCWKFWRGTKLRLQPHQMRVLFYLLQMAGAGRRNQNLRELRLSQDAVYIKHGLYLEKQNKIEFQKYWLHLLQRNQITLRIQRQVEWFSCWGLKINKHLDILLAVSRRAGKEVVKSHVFSWNLFWQIDMRHVRSFFCDWEQCDTNILC